MSGYPTPSERSLASLDSSQECGHGFDEPSYDDVNWLTPSEYELEAYYADQDSQVAAYRA